MHIFLISKYIISMALKLSLSVLNWTDQSFPLGIKPQATDFLSHSAIVQALLLFFI